MDIENLSDQELLRTIFMLLGGAFIFVALFIGSGIFEFRKRKQKEQHNPEFQNTTFPPAPPVTLTVGGSQEKMGSLLKSSGKKPSTSSTKSTKTPLQSRIQAQSQKKSPSPVAPASSPPITPASNDEYRELLTVLIHPTTKEIIVEVDGQRFKSLTQIKERHIGQRILETIAALLKFTNGMIVTATGIKNLPTPEPKLTVLPPAPSPQPSSQSAPEFTPKGGSLLDRLAPQNPQEQSPSTPPPAKTSLPPAILPQPQETKTEAKFWRLGFGGGGGSSTTPSMGSMGFNLAEEIDTLVQEKLLATRNPTEVKVRTGVGGSIKIQVESTYYDSVDEIENPTIKNLVKSAIKEWEQS